MSLSSTFIDRPIGTTLLTIAVALAGGVAYFFLPVSPLPQVEFPTIQVSASLPGASPETMASSVATPLERQFGRIAGVTEMTSSSSLGNTQVVLQFDLSRNVDAAARDVQAAINAARGNLPVGSSVESELPQGQPGRRADHAARARLRRRGQGPDLRHRLVDPPAENRPGRRRRAGLRRRRRAAGRACRGQSDGAQQRGTLARGRPHLPFEPEHQPPEGTDRIGRTRVGGRRDRPASERRPVPAAGSLLPERRRSASLGRCQRHRLGRGRADGRRRQRQAGGPDHHLPAARREHHRHRRPHQGRPASAPGRDPADDPSLGRARPFDDDPRLGSGRPDHPRDLDRARHPRRLRLPEERAGDPHSERRRSRIPDRDLRGDVSARLLDRQPVAHGLDDRDRLRRGRRDRRHREHHAAPRDGRGAPRSGPDRSPGDRLHRLLDQHFARRGLHSDPADGRNRRAALPRVRHDAVDRDPRVDGHLPDDDADDVRDPAQAAAARRSTAGSSCGASGRSTRSCRSTAGRSRPSCGTSR